MGGVEMTGTHVCIVSERLIPNLIPALMLGPEQVLLVSSAEMAELGMTARLEGLLSERGFRVVIRQGLPSGRLSRITDYARKLLSEVRQVARDEEIVLNLTGGNKLMTIALSQVFGPVAGRMIYTDTAHGLLEDLPGPSRQGGSHSLESVVDVPLYLSAQGMRLREPPSDESRFRESILARRSLTKYLGKRAGPLGSFIGQMNRLASRALDDSGEVLVEPLQSFDSRPRGSWLQAVSRIRETGLVRWNGGVGFEFVDREAARYLNGGWLEEYAWLVARGLRPDDLRLGVQGEWEGTRRGRNELDVVIVHRNRLLLIECKTLRLGRDAQSDSGLLYKLDSVGDDVRGLFGEVVLLSARETTPAIQDRASHHRIQVVGPERLVTLQRDIRDWMDRGCFPAGR
jgi:hypothetical protein